MLQTGFLKSVRCIILGRATKDCRSFQFVILLLCKYKNLNSFRPSKTDPDGREDNELSLRSSFFRF